MAIRKIARMGHPVLRKKARALSLEEILSKDTEKLIRDMYETMREYGGIGLAAPQIHESLQLALIDVPEENERYPNAVEKSVPLTVFFNPKITVLDPAVQGFWEGCLSIPEMRGYVERPRKVRVDYLDAQGKPRAIEAEGFLSTVLQHELDHLDGVLYIDRIKNGPGQTKLAFIEEYQRFILPQEAAQELPD